MAFASSFLAIATIRDMLKQDIAVNWANTSAADTLKVALFSSSVLASTDTDPLKYGTAPWNANEVTGTGWSSGGVTLSSPTCTSSAGVGVVLDASDVSQSSTTLSGVHGCLIYDSSVSDYGLVAVSFGSDYATVAGTLGITWDSSGIAVIDLTP